MKDIYLNSNFFKFTTWTRNYVYHEKLLFVQLQLTTGVYMYRRNVQRQTTREYFDKCF